MDLISVVRFLPDSLRENPFGTKKGFQLTDAQLDTLISQRNVVIDADCEWELIHFDSQPNHLKLNRLRSEDGLTYEFLQLSGKRSSKWFLIIQRLDDHCCSHSRWGLFEEKDGILINRTDGRLPDLNWLDFYEKETFPNGQIPEGFAKNRFPIAIEIENHSKIKIELIAEYISINFPNAISSPMLKNFPKGPKYLIWEDEQFIWE